jgi:RNA polymerase sigma-70 factor (ECF subfamily)
MESFDDPQLIAAIRRGSVQALGDFIELNRPRLLGFLRTITGEHLLARMELDDLFQEVATGAISALPRTPFETLEPWGWLQELSRRRVVDAHRFHFGAERRAAGRQTSLDAAVGTGSERMSLKELLIASITTPSQAVSRDLRLARVQQAIQSLSSEQQEIIKLRYVDGMPTKQIAEQVGKTDTAVRVILTRSVRKLEELLVEV